MWFEFTDYACCLVAAPCTSALLHVCVFCTALLGLFYVELACGASAARCAIVPAPRVRDAQIQHPCDATRKEKEQKADRRAERAGQGRQGMAEGRAGQGRVAQGKCNRAE